MPESIPLPFRLGPQRGWSTFAANFPIEERAAAGSGSTTPQPVQWVHSSSMDWQPISTAPFDRDPNWPF